ncbi:MAG TPA: tetratricopeptide repeat protein, partial [Thermoanaerobaculia bacterium]
STEVRVPHRAASDYPSQRLPLPALALAILLAPARNDASEAVHLIETHHYADARRLLEPQAKTDATGESAYWLGRIAIRTLDLDLAVEWLERAVTANPAVSERHHWLGRAYGQKALRSNVIKQAVLARKVRQEFEEAVRLDPANLDARYDLEEFYLVAPGFMGGSMEKAEGEAREIRSRDAMAGYEAWGRIYSQKNDGARAEAEFRRAIAEFPKEPEPYYWLANHFQRQKETARAMDVLESLLKANPEAPGAYYGIARLALASGERLDRAEECLKIYLTKQPGKDDPAPAWAHFRLGGIYEKKGNRAGARAEYQTALELEPGLIDAREALKKL